MNTYFNSFTSMSLHSEKWQISYVGRSIDGKWPQSVNPEQGHSEEGKPGQIEVSGLEAKVGGKDRGDEKWKRKQPVK